MKIGPSWKTKPSSFWSKTLPPVTSLGIRSGVNWMRLNVAPSTCASVRTSSVLPRPGTPSTSTWPPASTAIERVEDEVVLPEQHAWRPRGG